MSSTIEVMALQDMLPRELTEAEAAKRSDLCAESPILPPSWR